MIWATKCTALVDSIDASTNRSKEIFAIMKDFTSPVAASNSITPSQNLCNKVSQFFNNKINTIYSNFNPQLDLKDLAKRHPILSK